MLKIWGNKHGTTQDYNDHDEEGKPKKIIWLRMVSINGVTLEEIDGIIEKALRKGDR